MFKTGLNVKLEAWEVLFVRCKGRKRSWGVWLDFPLTVFWTSSHHHGLGQDADRKFHQTASPLETKRCQHILCKTLTERPLCIRMMMRMRQPMSGLQCCNVAFFLKGKKKKRKCAEMCRGESLIFLENIFPLTAENVLFIYILADSVMKLVGVRDEDAEDGVRWRRMNRRGDLWREQRKGEEELVDWKKKRRRLTPPPYLKLNSV